MYWVQIEHQLEDLISLTFLHTRNHLFIIFGYKKIFNDILIHFYGKFESVIVFKSKCVKELIIFDFFPDIFYCLHTQYTNKEDVVAQEAGVTIYYLSSRHFNTIECDERN